MTPAEFRRFEKYVNPEPMSGCWLWSGGATRCGYGLFNIGGVLTRYAHRLSFEHHRGPIPAGYEVDHLCRVRPCVNPQHLDAVTRLVNVRRQYGVSDDGDTCHKGHRNWRAQISGRYCRTCKTDVARERRHAV